jgi:hypothetical protein
MTTPEGESRDREQVRRSVYAIADRAATKAVKETLLALGVDVSDPIEAQKQFHTLRQLSNPRTLDNLAWLETVHGTSEVVAKAGWRALTTSAFTGIVALLAVMTKEYWSNHIPWIK